MNANLRRTLIALAVMSVFTVSAAYAQEGSGTSTSSSVKISKKVSLTSDVNVNGDVKVDGTIAVNAAAVALSSANQYSDDNTVNNNSDVSNKASITGSVGQSDSGNVGVNQAAVDFNAQGNNASIAAGGAASSSSGSSDADFTFDNCGGGGGGWGAMGCGKDPGGSSSANAGTMADAETFATQKIEDSKTHNKGTTDNAKITDNAFQGVSGNLGVNQVAGNGNEQLNQLSAATSSDNVYALATSTLDQEWSGNSVQNDPGSLGWCSPEQATTNTATLSGSVAAEASGNIGLNQAAGTGNMQSNSLSLAAASGH
jgi:hypothetical protein